MRQLRALLVLELLIGFTLGGARAQEPASLEQMRQALQQAAELQQSELTRCAEKLEALLTELRARFRQSALSEEGLRIYQDALLLQLRTQSKLLADEAAIYAILRETLVANPRMDDTVFNPRERLLVEKMRSAETGRLGLQSSPPGAQLSYGGILLGNTPVDIPLLAGTYRLRLSKDGYRDEEFEATIRAAEMLGVERPLRRRTLQTVLSVKGVPAVQVSVNGKSAGITRNRERWLDSLNPEQSASLLPLAGDANSSFIHLSDITAGEALSLELRADCYVPKLISLTIREDEVDWQRPWTIVPGLLNVELKRDTGTLLIDSSPSGGAVLLDGAAHGKTPASVEVCAGSHAVQVLHASGQYAKSVLVKRGESVQVHGELKPALAFLGVYSTVSGKLIPSPQDWDPVASHLSTNLTAFSEPPFASADFRTHTNGSPALGELLGADNAVDGSEAAVTALARKAGHADLLLFGVRSGDRVVFRLFSTAGVSADVLEIPNVEPASLEFLAGQINSAERTASLLQTPHVELEVVQLPRGLVIRKDARPAAEARPPLTPGTVIRSIDQKTMDYAELKAYVRGRQPGQLLTLDVGPTKEAAALLTVPVRYAASEYPWGAPQGLPNAIMAILRNIIEKDPDSRPAQLARLGLARGLMQRGAWKRALELLEKTNLEPLRSGVSAGTVLYYRGRCWEELQDHAQAIAQYTRAAEYPDATLGSVDGIPIAELVQRRLEALRKPTR